MVGVLEGFGVIAVIIGLGFLLAHLGVVDTNGQRSLSRIVFFVASPALLFTLVAEVDAVTVLSSNVVVAAGSIAITGVICAAIARWRWKMGLGESVITVMASSYANAGNLGIPIAVYVLGTTAAVAGLLLLQVLVIAPVAFVLLDIANRGRRPSPLVIAGLIVRNPVSVGSLLGLAVALLEWKPPEVIYAPTELVAGMAIPGMLIAYGISLRLGPRPGRGARVPQIAVITVVKLVIQPLAAYLIGAYALGLEAEQLLAVTVVAGLPTAQNIFVYAVRYNHATLLARDSILVTTILSVPVVVLIAALLA